MRLHVYEGGFDDSRCGYDLLDNRDGDVTARFSARAEAEAEAHRLVEAFPQRFGWYGFAIRDRSDFSRQPVIHPLVAACAIARALAGLGLGIATQRHQERVAQIREELARIR